MGSTGILIYNTNFFQCLNSITPSKTIVPVTQRKPRQLDLSSKSRIKRFDRIVCFAVEDVTEKQQEISVDSLNGAGPAVEDRLESSDVANENPFLNNEPDTGGNSIYDFLYPSKELLPDDKEMSIYDHLEELRERVFTSVLAVGAAIAGCFLVSKELIMFLEAPVRAQGVRFLQLAPGEFFFTSLKLKLSLLYGYIIYNGILRYVVLVSNTPLHTLVL